MKKIFMIAFVVIFAFSANAQEIFSSNPLSDNLVQKIELTQEKDLTMITQSTSQNIDGGTVTCNAGGLHADNSFYRVFDLANDFSITNDWTIYRLDFAVSTAVAAGTAGGVQPGSVKIYSLVGDLLLANLTLLGEEDISIPDDTGTPFMIEHTLVTPIDVPAGSVIVYEFFLPDGQTDGHSCYPGISDEAENDDSYLMADACSISEITTFTAIGFPEGHLIMNVWGGEPSADTYDVTYNVDMTDSIASGYFVEGTDVLYVTGSFVGTAPDGWAEPGTEAADQQMTPTGTDNIYTLTRTDTVGAQEYKYFKNAGWTNGEWDGGDNRSYEIVDADLVLNDVFGVAPNAINELDAEIAIGPNPTTGIINITADNKYNVDVIDMTGKIVMSSQMTSNNTTVDISAQQSGLYIVRLSNSEGIVTHKIIKK